MFSGTVGLGLTAILIFKRHTCCRTHFGAARCSAVLLGVAMPRVLCRCWAIRHLGLIGAAGGHHLRHAQRELVRHRGGAGRGSMARGRRCRSALPVPGVIIGIINLTGVAPRTGGHILPSDETSLFGWRWC